MPANAGPPSLPMLGRPPPPGGRSRQNEPGRRRFLQQRVNHAEQLRHPLNFVDDQGALFRRTGNRFAQTFGAGAQATVQGRVKQVQVEGIRQAMPQPSGFARAARPEQEAALVWNLEKSTCKFHFASKSGNMNSTLHRAMASVKSAENQSASA